MNFLIHRNRTKAWLAGALAAVILVLPLTGCQNQFVSDLLSSPVESVPASSAQSQASSQSSSQSPSNAASSQKPKVSSAATSSKAAAKTSSVAPAKSVQKVQTQKTAVTKAPTGNQSVKKITVDQSTQNTARLAVTQSTAATAGYSHIDQRGGYNYLPDVVSRSLYNGIMQSVYKVALQPNSSGYYPTQRISISDAHLSEAQLRVAMMAFLNDNPQVFWVANAFSYGYSGNDTYFQMYSVVPQSQCNTMIQQLNSRVTAIIKAMPSGLSELDREIYLFDYLTKNCVYDTAAVTDSTRWKAFTSYGALVEGTVVCEGYSRSMQLLSSYAGLQSMLLTGQSNGVNHMWNLMKIDGNWYHLDVTWSDNDPTVYNYFNVTDAVIKQTHTIFPTASSLTENQISGSDGSAAVGCNLSLPTCTATDANYFKAKGIHLSDLNGTNDSAAVSAIVAAANQKKESVSFYTEESADYNQILNGMVKASPYQLMVYLNDADHTSGIKNQIALNSIKYLADEADRGLTVFLSYQ